ncbi:Alb1-domain-containing protein [Astrocystis sublimbata]|nr:Alb1-domain-containing protein [Astrocystis sublimbata]
MAKPTIAKKKKGPSIRSRAARRATSPGIDTDKSLKNVQPPPESVDHRPSILALHVGAGVTKKQKKGRALSSRARKRQEKAQDRAAAIMERTETKIAKSKDSSRAIQGRSEAWDKINQSIPSDLAAQAAGPGRAKGTTYRPGEDNGSDDSEFDDEMGDAGAVRGANIEMATPAAASEMTVDQDEHDGIL